LPIIVLLHARIDNMTKNVKRLSAFFKPNNYKVEIRPDKNSMTFRGTVQITGKYTHRPSQRIVFHQNGLKIIKAKILKNEKKEQRPIPVKRINHHRKYDEVRLHASDTIFPGSYTIRLEFQGEITQNMNGMYPCKFEHEGITKQLIATQFESHHAREVFPCIDEPEAKATFDLTLHSPLHETVLSNTPIKNQTTVDNTHITTFETTPLMPTYLLAFAFGELAYKEAHTKDGVLVRTYATPENIDFTDFALDVAVKCLEFYNDYFAIPYPLKKCDMIALPDFASGAMENWGLITYREQAMFVDHSNTTLAAKQYVAMVVAHELAHQWFGNLVTMRWWTDLWLNEGFASWIEYMAVDHIFPEWEMWTQFNVDEQQQALKLDALEHTHPIEVTVNHPEEIRTIFDAISYSKGASIIHMLHDYLGTESFRDGLRHYLSRHKYANTDTVDLWTALEEISDKPVREFMHAWTTQSGFPLLHAEVTHNSVSVKQERFFSNPRHRTTDPSTWPVALLSNHSAVPEILTENAVSIELHDTSSFKLNMGQSGFYRVTYNSSHLKRLGELIREGKLSVVDRVGILSDLFESAKSGHANTIDTLHFLQNFSNEDNYAVWDIISSVVGTIRTVMDDEDLREDMKPYIRELVSPQLKRLGWDKRPQDTHFDKLLRPIILGMSASADETWVLSKCQSLFKTIVHIDDVSEHLRSNNAGKQLKRGIDIDPDLRGTVFGTVARLGAEDEFSKMLHLHNTSTLSEERNTLAAAMTGFQQKILIKRALSLITTDNVRKQDVSYWVAYSFLNRHARSDTWIWLKEHWEWLEKHFSADLSFYRMPLYAARVHSNEQFIKEYREFFEPKMSPALERSFNQGIEMIEWHAAWKQRSLKEVKTYFKNRLP
jgi:puromycin-sensitive aminopeptidase